MLLHKWLGSIIFDGCHTGHPSTIGDGCHTEIVKMNPARTRQTQTRTHAPNTNAHVPDTNAHLPFIQDHLPCSRPPEPLLHLFTELLAYIVIANEHLDVHA